MMSVVSRILLCEPDSVVVYKKHLLAVSRSAVVNLTSPGAFQAGR